MKKVFYPLACCCLAAGVFASCGGQKKANAQEEPSKVALSYSKSLKAPETDSLNLPVDENGYITIFDGETFNGWRGYGKDRVPKLATGYGYGAECHLYQPLSAFRERNEKNH